MSSLKDKLKMAVKSAATIASNAIDGKDLLVSDEVYKQRLAACQVCPRYNKELGQCLECGCFIKSVKGKLAGMECPLHKWPK